MAVHDVDPLDLDAFLDDLPLEAPWLLPLGAEDEDVPLPVPPLPAAPATSGAAAAPGDPESTTWRVASPSSHSEGCGPQTGPPSPTAPPRAQPPPQAHKVDAAEEARRAARLARNREAAAASRERRRAVASDLEERCAALEAAKASLEALVARLAAENHALRAHVLAHCPPKPGPTPAGTEATVGVSGAPTPPPLLPVPPLGPPLAPPPPGAVPPPKLALPRLAVPARPAPAPPRAPAAKRPKRAALAASILFAASFLLTGPPPPVAPGATQQAAARLALAPPGNATGALAAAAAAVLAPTAALGDTMSNTSTLSALLPPPGLNASTAASATAGDEPGETALVPLYRQLGVSDDGTLQEWLATTWEPLLSYPLSDARARTSLQTLSRFAAASAPVTSPALLASLTQAVETAEPATALWLPAVPLAPTCRPLLEFSAPEDATGTATASGTPDTTPSPPLRPLRRLGPSSNAYALPPEPTPPEAVRVALLPVPAGAQLGGPVMGPGAVPLSGRGRQVLLVVALQQAARHLTFACSL